MRTFIILGCAAVAVGAGAYGTYKWVKHRNKHVAKVTKASVAVPSPTPSTSPAAAIVERLHPTLAERFATVPTDQRFGIEREPEQLHIQDGVINPAAVKKWADEERKREGKKFKELGSDQLPTKEEMALIEQLRESGYDFQVYTVGLKQADYTRVRGPVGDLNNYPGDAIWKEVEDAGAKVNIAGSPDSVDSTSADGKVFFKAKSIKMSQDRCQKCHEGVKPGEKVGAIVYRFWPRTSAKV